MLILRGACRADQDPIKLRLQVRDWEGDGRGDPPRMDNRLLLVGFRCAWYLQAARDRLEAVVARAVAKKYVAASEIVRERFDGSDACHFSEPGPDTKNHVFVKARSWAILVAPKDRIWPLADKAPSKTPRDVLAEAKGLDPVVVGIFHSDLALDAMDLHVKPAAGDVAPPAKGGKPAPVPPAQGRVRPGTYVVGVWHGRVGLFHPNLEPVAYFAVPPDPKDKSAAKADPRVRFQVEAKDLAKDEPPPVSTLSVSEADDVVTASFWVATGGKDTKPSEGMTFSFGFRTVKGEAARVGPWRE